MAAKSSSSLSCKNAVCHAEYATQNNEKNLSCLAAHHSEFTTPFPASQVSRPRHICNAYEVGINGLVYAYEPFRKIFHIWLVKMSGSGDL